jgi:hypothetical protein
MPAIAFLIIFRVICRLEDRNIGTRVSHLQSLKKCVQVYRKGGYNSDVHNVYECMW